MLYIHVIHKFDYKKIILLLKHHNYVTINFKEQLFER